MDYLPGRYFVYTDEGPLHYLQAIRKVAMSFGKLENPATKTERPALSILNRV